MPPCPQAAVGNPASGNPTPRYVICDRDGKYGWEVPAARSGLGVKPVRTAPRAPWQNGVAERWVGSVRRELLDQVVIFNQAQLHRLLAEYVRYYHEDRCHLTLGKDTPDGRLVSPRPSPDAQVIGVAHPGPRQGGWRWPRSDGDGRE